MRRLRVRCFGTTFVVHDPERVEGRYFGPCLQGTYVEEGSDHEEYGAFPLDRCTDIEEMRGQMELRAAMRDGDATTKWLASQKEAS